MKKWIISLIGGLAIGGAAGTMVGARIMYNKCHESMEMVENELNNLLFQLKDAKKEAEEINASTSNIAEMIGQPEETSTETYPWGTGKHTPAYQIIRAESDEITVIPFDDFEIIPEYESETLFYYPETGDILDDKHNPIGKQKLKEMIGEDAINHFDEYDEDPDCVRIRNDTMKTYFELLRYYTSP